MTQPAVPRKTRSLLSYIRYRDAVIGQAISIAGLVFFFPAWSLQNVEKALLVCLGSFLLVASLFAFNDLTDIALDSENSQKSPYVFLNEGLTGRAMLRLALLLAAAGILAVAFISAQLAVFAVLMVLFGVAYSFPVKGLKVKGIPVLSSVLHFVGTVLTFLVGSTAFAPVNSSALLIGCYFGLLISAGHFVQEVQDYADDRLAGMHTNAVQFGQKPVFVAACVLFGLSFLYLIGLARAGLVTLVAQYAVLLYPVFVIWALSVYRSGLDKVHVRALRDKYRILFGVVVLVMLAGAVMQKGLLF